MAEATQESEVASSPSKAMNIATWIVTALVGLAFMASGAYKLGGLEEASKTFEHFGLPAGMAAFIGACEVAGGIGVFIPKVTSLAASGLAVIMLGAIYSHLSHDPASQAIPATVLLCFCGFIVWSRGLPFVSR